MNDSEPRTLAEASADEIKQALRLLGESLADRAEVIASGTPYPDQEARIGELVQLFEQHLRWLVAKRLRERAAELRATAAQLRAMAGGDPSSSGEESDAEIE